MKKIFLLILSFQLFILHSQLNAQTGTLDESFGNGGKVIANDIISCAYDLALQKDGKIITMGISNITGNHFITRFNIDGSIDKSFGDNGYAYFDFQYPTSVFLSLAVQPDNKIILAGYGTIQYDPEHGNVNYNILIARFLPDGTLDNTFGQSGYLKSDLGNQETCKSIKLLSNGSIVAAGSWAQEYGSPLSFLIACYKTDGTIDENFGTQGKVITNFGEWVSANIESIAIQPDDKIVAGGGMGSVTSNNSKLAFARYTAVGKLDESFGTQGQNIIDITNLYDGLTGIKLLDDGSIISTGYAGRNILNENDSIFILSLNQDGTKNKNFGNNGIVSTKFGGSAAYANGIAIEKDNKIIIAGTWTENKESYANLLVAKFKSIGTLDSTFGKNGITTTYFGINSQTGQSLAIQDDSKIVLAGTDFLYSESIFNLALARYNNDPTLPLTFTNVTTTTSKNSITLNWQTVTEINNSYFSIERSTAKSFNEIGQVQSSTTHQYSFTDTNPLAGNNYYRIKQVDKDGSYSYSKTVTASFTNGNISIHIKPNPVKDILTIEGLNQLNNYQLSIINEKGNIILLKNINGLSSYTWNVAQMQSSVYFLKAVSGNQTTTLKFIKQ